MKFLVNNKEYAEFLAYYQAKKHFQFDYSNPEPAWKKTSKMTKDFEKILNPSEYPEIQLRPTKKSSPIIQNLIRTSVESELLKWQTSQTDAINTLAQPFKKYINQHYSVFDQRTRHTIHQLFCQKSHSSLSTQLISSWQNCAEFTPRESVEFCDPAPLFIRNTVSNEELLKTRIQDQLPFLFMDSGYTNFLEDGKVWHRLVQNHIHNDRFIGKFNNKRMHVFKSLPMSWRTDGATIIVIEPSTIQCTLFDIDIEHWRNWVKNRLQRYLTRDKQIVFREKVDKKIRESFYQHVQNEDVYCVVHYNSNAAIEALWAGVPVITLGKHISSLVSATSLDQINNLLRPDLDSWLKRLSYSQYTVEEITNGTARKILEEKIYV